MKSHTEIGGVVGGGENYLGRLYGHWNLLLPEQWQLVIKPLGVKFKDSLFMQTNQKAGGAGRKISSLVHPH